MDNSSEVRAFLTSRRAKVTPEQAGIPAYGSRRVAGLRRGEVAALAGVSVEYYTRLERGNLSGASESVLDAVARALRLDETETAHLHHLARAAGPQPARARARRDKTPEIRPAIRRVLDSMTGVPAFLRNHRFDILAANPLGMALYAPMFAAGATLPVNSMRFNFLNPHAQAFYPQWAQVSHSAVAALRIAAAQNPDDQQLMNLIGELSMRSEPFRTMWAAQDVYVHRHGTKLLRHPAIGELDLAFEALELPGNDGLTILTYSAEPGTPSGDGLELLATWAATQKAKTAPARD
ncbi:helix-turn-helix transcriptional regulator [Micromonospora parathelypteridis]|uniref:Transcriptional regulator with XRE-family HTH domain n=1 Tax=Micromonospora parathelypteridis TaxID=1839617 RepID=A0A840VXA8_9ACTN|nr:helix-turn-helix transcriptional regulator [Micromonospora parathelypteridis]MBB5480646.1 transcriptional regulator with XRE-family HTH domain [Micromonospora parathelypteridis]GGO22373.1 transcriptional regulator [Micromonospora parathelypteridis]